MKRILKEERVGKEERDKKKITVISSNEDRLKIFANLIIDRILEDQRNGILRLEK